MANSNSASDVAGQVRLARSAEFMIPALLLLGAAVGWWWSVHTANDMDSMNAGHREMGEMASMAVSQGMSFAAYVSGWAAMMTAMMFPAISPMVRLYARAAAKGNVAPVPFFVAGYLAVWTTIGIPAYFAWRQIADPLADGSTWVGRMAGATLVLAAVYQFTPLKAACLSHCRSPISFFIRHGGSTINTPFRAARLGMHHGLFCLGCCWAIMAVLVAVGTMQLAWMAVLAAVIFLEKVAPRGESLSAVAALGFAVIGVWLLADPTAITTVT